MRALLRKIFGGELTTAHSKNKTINGELYIGPEEWKSGWKTKRVIATRYKNPHMGYNIGFRFPGNDNNCDRAELCEFVRANGGHIYQCGGWPGAEMFATFDGVTDKESANTKLISFLPELDRFMLDTF